MISLLRAGANMAGVEAFCSHLVDQLRTFNTYTELVEAVSNTRHEALAYCKKMLEHLQLDATKLLKAAVKAKLTVQDVLQLFMQGKAGFHSMEFLAFAASEGVERASIERLTAAIQVGYGQAQDQLANDIKVIKAYMTLSSSKMFKGPISVTGRDIKALCLAGSDPPHLIPSATTGYLLQLVEAGEKFSSFPDLVLRVQEKHLHEGRPNTSQPVTFRQLARPGFNRVTSVTSSLGSVFGSAASTTRLSVSSFPPPLKPFEEAEEVKVEQGNAEKKAEAVAAESTEDTAGAEAPAEAEPLGSKSSESSKSSPSEPETKPAVTVAAIAPTTSTTSADAALEPTPAEPEPIVPEPTESMATQSATESAPTEPMPAESMPAEPVIEPTTATTEPATEPEPSESIGATEPATEPATTESIPVDAPAEAASLADPETALEATAPEPAPTPAS